MSASLEKNKKPGVSRREPALHLHTAFHSTLNAQCKPTIGIKREGMFSLRQIASLIQCDGHVTSLHNPVVILREAIYRSGVQRTQSGTFLRPGGTISPTTLHPLTPPYEIGRELARSCYLDTCFK
jgi:hypothetical protein